MLRFYLHRAVAFGVLFLSRFDVVSATLEDETAHKSSLRGDFFETKNKKNLLLSNAILDVDGIVKKDNKNILEDGNFWERLLQSGEEGSMVAPTPSPGTPEPTPSPMSQSPTTPEPTMGDTPSPVSQNPSTPEPTMGDTPSPVSQNPSTPEPTMGDTPSPVSQSPTTPEPTMGDTPSPVSQSPTTPAPTMGSTPSPVSQSPTLPPATTMPSFPGPRTLPPQGTPSPETQSPVTPAPTSHHDYLHEKIRRLIAHILDFVNGIINIAEFIGHVIDLGIMAISDLFLLLARLRIIGADDLETIVAEMDLFDPSAMKSLADLAPTSMVNATAIADEVAELLNLAEADLSDISDSIELLSNANSLNVTEVLDLFEELNITNETNIFELLVNP